MSELQQAIALAEQHKTAKGVGRRNVMPAPVGGWNTNDPLANMEPTYATQMDNYFPERGRVVGRKGYAQFADTTDSGAIETLFSYRNGTTETLYACSPTKIYDVTAPGSITEAVATGITNGRWSTVNMNGNAIFVNGVDTPLRIDGTGSFVAHGFTGPATVGNLETVTVHKNRLYFTAKDSSKFWYGGNNAITGALTDFDLSNVVSAGGNIAAIGSLSMDTGSGVDDLLAIFMDQGQVLIWFGDDPGDVARWGLQGIFQLGPVVGDRPLVNLGADLICITADGYIPLLQFLDAGREQRPACRLGRDSAQRDGIGSALQRSHGLAGGQLPGGQLATLQRPT